MRVLFPVLLALAACSPIPGSIDADGDGSPAGADCDDTRADVFPGGIELCDAAGVDEDCDGRVNAEDPDVADRVVLHADADGDGYGGPSTTSTCPGTGWTADATDCDDADPAIHPGAGETCDLARVDEDCDGLVNGADDDATGGLSWYVDADGDGWGGDTLAVACDQPPGFVTVGGDCVDTDPARNPGATEICNALDDDCDAAVDEGVTSRVHPDHDGDGYGEPGPETEGCLGAGWSTDDTDCDDTRADTHPDAEEVCADGVDQDCDGGAGTCDLVGPRTVADADATFFGNAVGDAVGTALAGVGDTDGDGLDDWLVGAPTSNRTGTLSGIAWLLPGGALGDLEEGDALARFTSGSLGAGIGAAGIGLGDIDGDGLGDVAVAAVNASHGAGREGAVAVWWGGLTGDSSLETAPASVWGDGALGRFGATMAFAADLDGDTAIDLVVAAPDVAAGGVGRGRVYVLPSPTGGAVDVVDVATATVDGDTDGQALGTRLAVAGDLDGDGVGELVLGDPGADEDRGEVRIFSGPLAGAYAAADADLTLRGWDPAGEAGACVVAPGDLDGDGHADLALTAPRADEVGYESGAVYLVYGPATGLDDLADADAALLGENGWDHAGTSLASAGDLDGDGVPDLLLTAGEWPDGAGTGRVYGVSGASAGRTSLADALLLLDADRGTVGFGTVLAGAGDLDGDGRADILTAAPQSALAELDAGASWAYLNRGL